MEQSIGTVSGESVTKDVGAMAPAPGSKPPEPGRKPKPKTPEKKLPLSREERLLILQSAVRECQDAGFDVLVDETEGARTGILILVLDTYLSGDPPSFKLK
jgi:hypothetical protein